LWILNLTWTIFSAISSQPAHYEELLIHQANLSFLWKDISIRSKAIERDVASCEKMERTEPLKTVNAEAH
jgi:hypothetical protein